MPMSLMRSVKSFVPGCGKSRTVAEAGLLSKAGLFSSTGKSRGHNAHSLGERWWIRSSLQKEAAARSSIRRSTGVLVKVIKESVYAPPGDDRRTAHVLRGQRVPRD